MSQTVSPSTSRSYGLARVSRAWSVSRAGVYRFLKRTTSPAITRRRGPPGPCPDADLADHIRREIEASDFHGEGYRKLWARLRVAGVRSSPRRVRRVMGENGLLAPHRVGGNQEKTHDGTIVTGKVNEMWGTDMSQTVTLEKGGPMFSSPSNTRTQKSSAFTPRVQPIASRRWSPSARGCIGASAPSRHSRPDPCTSNKVSRVRTIDLVAKDLGEDVDFLFDVAIEMEPEDGLIWVLSLADESVMAFTDDGVESPSS